MSTRSEQTAGTTAAANGDGARRRPRRGRRLDDEFGAVHVYEPHKVGLPPLRSYFREAWRRREFAIEMARTKLRGQNYNTAFGQLWLVLNPVLLGLVYFLLVSILRPDSGGLDFLTHLLGALFAFQIVGTAVNEGARSVVQGGRLILNTAFPRTLLPLSAVMVSVARFLPTLAVYAPLHVAAGLPVGPEMLWLVPLVVLLVVFGMGVAMFVAAANVYFRDLSSFLPYVTRIWLYGSPVLYYYADAQGREGGWLLLLNPLTPILTSWSDILDLGEAPGTGFMLLGVAWALGACVLGTLFFISREREFAIRL
jgi:teichoic acid transport system permease protein